MTRMTIYQEELLIKKETFLKKQNNYNKNRVENFLNNLPDLVSRGFDNYQILIKKLKEQE